LLLLFVARSPASLVSPVYGAAGCPVLDIHGTAERCQPLTRNAQVAALTGGGLYVGLLCG